MEQQKKMTLKRRTTSTIPFGYKQSEEVNGFLEPIPEQLEALEEVKGYILNGSLSLLRSPLDT
mgnify:CR=1 FL=1